MTRPPSEWTNAKLVQECLRGSEQAWNALIDRYKGLIYSIPVRWGAGPQDAADIFQAVCLDLFNELPRLRDVDALQGWLIRVTTNKCHRWKRTLGAQTDWDQGEMEGRASEEVIPPDVLADLERQQMIRESLEQLPARCRQMIEMLFFNHPPMPYEDVARSLNLARGSIGFIRGRCLQRLRRILEEKGF